MHGCGNDFLITDGSAAPSAAVVRALCDRRRGVGADGVIHLERSNIGVRVRVTNADGSDGGMSGNGARCVARRAAELGWADGSAVRLDVGGRAVEAELLGENQVRVDMGAPALALAEIPVNASGLDELGEFGVEHQVAGLPAVFVSMGNPHLVAMIEEAPERFDLEAAGPKVERHRAFPEGMNLHVARVNAEDAVAVRSWERGVGPTLACGTGACATLVAGVLTGRLKRAATVRMAGGDLHAEWGADGRVRLTGPAVRVCEGEWDPGSAHAAAPVAGRVGASTIDTPE